MIGHPYPLQLQRKCSRLLDAFAPYPSLAGAALEPIVSSPHRLGYRARVKLVVRKTRGEIVTGLYVPQTHKVVDISSCPVHPPPINRVLRYLKGRLLSEGIIPYDEKNGEGNLRFLDFRYSFFRRELTLTLVTRHAHFPQGRPLGRKLRERFPFVRGVIHNINQTPGNVIWGEQFKTLAGRDTLIERIGFAKLILPPGVFSQANPALARKLYEIVLELAHLEGDENVLDLYCGVGPISLHLAAHARLVWGVDESARAIAAAKQNARMNGVHNCRFLAGNCGEIVKSMTSKMLGLDLAVVNPPRTGLQPDAMDALRSLHVPRMIYVSCNPITLARDLDVLLRTGYVLHQVRPFDMFPQTEEVEAVAVLGMASKKVEAPGENRGGPTG